ncbi:DUF3325 domain-containing protein [Cupriavidus sp. YAF13]|uniref:DUF3325 domain-containing protein n=1 Tax=Cupriavidus sp. YAF13 TaxID=3233075 RepID=UPI003F8F4240
MSASLGFLTALALTYSGFTALSQTLDRHYADRHGRGAAPSPAARLRLQGLGWAALALALAACVQQQGWPMGSVSWIGTLTLGALVLVLLLSYAPAIAVRAARWAGMLGGCGLLTMGAMPA